MAGTDTMELAYWRALERIDGPIGRRQEELAWARQTAAIAGPLGGDPEVVNHLPAWYQKQPDLIAALRMPRQNEAEMKKLWNHHADTWGT